MAPAASTATRSTTSGAASATAPNAIAATARPVGGTRSAIAADLRPERPGRGRVPHRGRRGRHEQRPRAHHPTPHGERVQPRVQHRPHGRIAGDHVRRDRRDERGQPGDGRDRRADAHRRRAARPADPDRQLGPLRANATRRFAARARPAPRLAARAHEHGCRTGQQRDGERDPGEPLHVSRRPAPARAAGRLRCRSRSRGRCPGCAWRGRGGAGPAPRTPGAPRRRRSASRCPRRRRRRSGGGRGPSRARPRRRPRCARRPQPRPTPRAGRRRDRAGP